MTKWFDTNYHCIKPEIEKPLVLTRNFALDHFAEAKELGVEPKPVLIGPCTLLHYVVNRRGTSPDGLLEEITPLYGKVVEELARADAKLIQLDEPVIVQWRDGKQIESLKQFLSALARVKGSAKILLQTYYADVREVYQDLLSLPVDGIGLDFVRGDKNLDAFRRHGFPREKILAVGIVDGRGVWRSDLKAKASVVEEILRSFSGDLLIQPSCSLQHLPYTAADETKLAAEIKQWLAFAYERLDEVSLLTRYFSGEKGQIQSLIEQNAEMLRQKKKNLAVTNPDVQKRLSSLKPEEFKRNAPREERYRAQKDRLPLPPLPSTTIGSFPQTAEVRKKRLEYREGKITEQEYRSFIQGQIREWIQIQEEIGLDVLVHGEFERADMVAYFAEHLEGIANIQGWVQSYGTRYVQPPIIYGDVFRPKPMTVEWITYAQSLTKKPVKGMLTGPVTILNWSYGRDDISRRDQAYQIALAIRDEVHDLEAAGIKIIQIDEPAIREGLPLKRQEWEEYLDWAVRAFRLASSAVRPEIQIHTHMCFSEFGDIISSIDAMDADVITIEDSKQGGELAKSLHAGAYGGAMGLGVFDVHSPRVPSTEEMETIPKTVLEKVPREKIWINPDCGLKTRGRKETLAQLKNMVAAAKNLRQALSS
jgi:5-methyltetrahydropteroyltriglutamate--homocysteine methyltransferase